MTAIIVSAVLSAIGLGLCAGGIFQSLQREFTSANGYFVLANLALAASNAIIGGWVWFWFNVVVGIWSAISWWRGGGGGRTRKAARELGAKSRARVEALARQMTPSPIPPPAGAS